MANDTASMSAMFPTCFEVLKRERVFMHYARLTELALEELGLPRRDVNWSRQIEDVREKMLEVGRFGTLYVGAPYCLAGLRLWIKTGQLDLFHADSIVIPGNATSGCRGAYEALVRTPWMKTKKLTAGPVHWERVALTRARGFVLQYHVADWFARCWPEIVLPPENEGDVRRGCWHDFRLKVNSRIIKIDVTGPRLIGGFGNFGEKKPTDIHLYCEVDGPDVIWRGLSRGSDYDARVIPETTGSPIRFVVWLNCLRDGIDYNTVVQAARKGKR